jgi:hypothetical protein
MTCTVLAWTSTVLAKCKNQQKNYKQPIIKALQAMQKSPTG